MKSIVVNQLRFVACTFNESSLQFQFTSGLCPECSVKLNHGHQRREIKRSSKKRKHSKSASSRDHKKSKTADGPCSSGQSEKVDNKTPDDESAQSIWKEQVVIPELKSREDEYDEYIDDLFF